jgi:hypothetical protein
MDNEFGSSSCTCFQTAKVRDLTELTQLTNRQQSNSNSCSAHILGKPKLHYLIQKSATGHYSNKNESVKDYRFSQRCSSRWTSLGMWRCVAAWTVLDVRWTIAPPSSRIKESKEKVISFALTHVGNNTIYTAILRHIPEDFNPQMNQPTSFHPLPEGPFQLSSHGISEQNVFSQKLHRI